MPKSYFAPEVVGSIYQEVARILPFRRAGESIGENIVEFDLLRRRVASKMMMGAGLPGAHVCFLRMQNGALAFQEESSAPASTQESLKFMDWATTMRRLFGSCGGAALGER